MLRKLKSYIKKERSSTKEECSVKNGIDKIRIGVNADKNAECLNVI